MFFRLSDADATDERRDWLTLSDHALGKVWDNDADAAYDTAFQRGDVVLVP